MLDFFSYLLGEIRSVKTDMCNHTLEGVIEVEDTLESLFSMYEDAFVEYMPH